jgi:hypothetical protein
VGGFLLLVGVVGGFIPILQGWVFIVAGLSIMAPESTLAQGALDWAKRKLGRGGHGAGPDDCPNGETEREGAAGCSEGRAAADEKTRYKK